MFTLSETMVRNYILMASRNTKVFDQHKIGKPTANGYQWFARSPVIHSDVGLERASYTIQGRPSL